MNVIEKSMDLGVEIYEKGKQREEFVHIPVLQQIGSWKREWLQMENLISPSPYFAAIWQTVSALSKDGNELVWNVAAMEPQREGHIILFKNTQLCEIQKKNLPAIVPLFVRQYWASLSTPGILLRSFHAKNKLMHLQVCALAPNMNVVREVLDALHHACYIGRMKKGRVQ